MVRFTKLQYAICNMEKDKLIKLNSGESTLQKIYQCGKCIIKVKREFAEGEATVLEQTVAMLLDMMEKRDTNI